jgi:pyrroline-5-carboxylate reductase
VLPSSLDVVNAAGVHSGDSTVLDGVSLAFIGTGAMAEAMIAGLRRRYSIDPSLITASHHRPSQADAVRSRLAVRTTLDNRVAARDAQVVMLSVKPQVLRTVLNELHGAIQPTALVLSIVAGARIESIVDGLRHTAVVRCMPNTPAQVGEGITVWTATRDVTEVQRQQAECILAALGRQLYVEDEAYLDRATAISGTGPAYIFLLMEALIDAAVHLGFSRLDARTLVIQTIKGSAMFAEQSTAHPAEMRNMVTSPGGTSAEALYQLEKGGFRTVLSKAVWAAYQKSVSLGSLKNGVAPLDTADGGVDPQALTSGE